MSCERLNIYLITFYMRLMNIEHESKKLVPCAHFYACLMNCELKSKENLNMCLRNI